MKSWLITGGTGSFGKAFARRLLDGGAKRVVILSRDELKQAEMSAEFNDDRLRFMIGSVTDPARVEKAFHGVTHVVHAAAMKRIEVCEANPFEAVQTNLLGTATVADACIREGVQRAVFLSTDKAVGPNTHYGATKLAAERLWCRYNVYAAHGDTRFSATRYGNVLGSRGSVLPLFRQQALLGGPLTITDKRMTRFFMRMSEAVDLVAMAFREMRGGEVFVPMIGATSIVKLAEAVAPGVNWVETGIRPGEKLHEALLGADEARQTYNYGDHYRIETTRTWEDGMHADVQARKVPEGFEYTSEAADMEPGALRELVA